MVFVVFCYLGSALVGIVSKAKTEEIDVERPLIWLSIICLHCFLLRMTGGTSSAAAASSSILSLLQQQDVIIIINQSLVLFP
mmetsp:Transcript_37045/g.83394  ORF Transcript_37045/g.83394 Transcript_37045/m.83394 type:complete len:82 (-) Transcript_37045:2971-3216(-)